VEDGYHVFKIIILLFSIHLVNNRLGFFASLVSACDVVSKAKAIADTNDAVSSGGGLSVEQLEHGDYLPFLSWGFPLPFCDYIISHS
jgi:hypothetical protein